MIWLWINNIYISERNFQIYMLVYISFIKIIWSNSHFNNETVNWINATPHFAIRREKQL